MQMPAHLAGATRYRYLENTKDNLYEHRPLKRGDNALLAAGMGRVFFFSQNVVV